MQYAQRKSLLFVVTALLGTWPVAACTFDPLAKVSEVPDGSLLCGNGTVDPGEQCDGTDLNATRCEDLGFPGGSLRCTSSCRFDTSQCSGGSACGNGIIEQGEDCDGSRMDGKTCRDLGFNGGTLRCTQDCSFDTSNCEIPASCGNGQLDGTEACDDGNHEAGDGCSPACQVEEGWTCDGAEPSHCDTICGDGIVVQDREPCDDGNNDDNDGCAADCQVEDYFSCAGEPSSCTCRILVSQDSTATPPDGKTWDSAFHDVRDGIHTASNQGQTLGTTCEIWVAQGTYPAYIDNPDDSFVLADRVKLYGGFSGTETLRAQRDFSQHETILDAAGSKHVVTAQDVTDAVLDGFTITGGSEGDNGGGMWLYDSIVAVNHCTFDSNHANSGGALFLGGDSRATVRSCDFTNNQTDNGVGGAILLDDNVSLTIRTSTFQDNKAEIPDNDADGGAIAMWGSSTLEIWDSHFTGNKAADNGGAINATGQTLTLHNVTFDSNVANSQDSGGGQGGAVRNGYGSTAVIENCTFTSNQGRLGGAFLLLGGTVTITDSLFDGNSATHKAGALGALGDWDGRQGYVTVSRTIFSNNQATDASGAVRLTMATNDSDEDTEVGIGAFDNCLFYGNQVTDNPYGGAISVVYGATLTLDNSTVSQNSTDASDGSGGVSVYNATATIRNCIIWNNQGDDLRMAGDSTVTVTYSDVPDSEGDPWSGEGNIATDPSFADDAHQDFRLLTTSACIDAAENLGAALDLDGNQRNVDQPAISNSGPNGDSVDMGAYELQ